MSARTIGTGSRRTGWAAFSALVAALALSLPAVSTPPARDIQDVFSVLAPRPNQTGIFWKIERPGSKPSYLLGTMHVDDPAVTRLPDSVQRAFDQARVVCTEVKMDFNTMAAETREMFFNDGRTLRSVAGDNLYRRAVEVGRSRGMPESLLLNMKPWAVTYMLSFPESQGGVALDMKLYSEAIRDGKKVCGLETVEEHSRVFNSFSMEDQVYTLRMTLDHLGQVRAQYSQLREAYLARDLEALVRISADTPWVGRADLAQRFVDVLVVKRNRTMARRMEPYIKRGDAFFAVGALHLPGKYGVLHLLEQRGYRVTPVP